MRRFNLHLGERVDVILCTKGHAPGNYLIHAQYDYASALTKGHFVPPGFHRVPSCDFYGYLHYEGEAERFPRDLNGTGGGSHPASTSGADFDLTRPEGYTVTRPRNPEPEPAEPDVRYTINLGLLGPLHSKPTDRPLRKGRWYMDLSLIHIS